MQRRVVECGTSCDELVEGLDDELGNRRFANESIGAHGQSRLFIRVG